MDFYTPKKVTPKLENIDTEGHVQLGYRVKLTEQDVEECTKFSFISWSGTKPQLRNDAGETEIWNNGILNTPEDKRRTERIGKFGEVAFAKVMGYPVDMRYLKGGDEHDFTTAQGKTVNVKTAATGYRYLLIRGTDQFARVRIQLTSDIYVAAFVESEVNDNVSVCLVGFDWKENILKRDLVLATMKGATWMNYKTAFHELIGIDRFEV